jgi:hypothetical protein
MSTLPPSPATEHGLEIQLLEERNQRLRKRFGGLESLIPAMMTSFSMILLGWFWKIDVKDPARPLMLVAGIALGFFSVLLQVIRSLSVTR